MYTGLGYVTIRTLQKQKTKPGLIPQKLDKSIVFYNSGRKSASHD